jgi:hypothetical protein
MGVLIDWFRVLRADQHGDEHMMRPCG